MTRGIKELGRSLLLLALLAAGSQAWACTAGSLFSDCSDANPALFDIATSVPDPGDPNKLLIGLDAFMAGVGGGISAFDTLSVLVTAPAGFRITSIGYDEGVTASALGGSDTAVATGSVTANGVAKGLANVLYGPGSDGSNTLSTTFDYTGSLVTSAAVIITNSLFATGPTASITKDFASLEVGLALIPIPASVVLFGSALFGLALVRRGTTSA